MFSLVSKRVWTAAAVVAPRRTLPSCLAPQVARRACSNLVDDSHLPYRNRTRVVIEMPRDEPGALQKAIRVFERSQVNMTHIESRLNSFHRAGPSFHIDFEGRSSDPQVKELLDDLRRSCSDVVVMPDRPVPWFPWNIRELDLTKETLDGGTDLINDDHPGFNDPEYKARRNHLSEVAQTYRHGRPIPNVDYNEKEVETWGLVYSRLAELHEKYACKEYLQVMPQMAKHCGYAKDNIPQLQDISDFLHDRTGFTLRPVQGLLSARDFLNALAHRVFFSTQYIRHHGNPYYTPEPDVVHELVGHVPLFGISEFADFSHEIGLASLGASDEEIDKLASNYWFTVEFGLCREGDQVKALGAGLLSSFGEIEWACSESPSLECRQNGGLSPDIPRPNLLPYDPFKAASQTFPITTYQPTYFVADSLADVKGKVSEFCDSLERPFFPQYNALTKSVLPSKAVRRLDRTTTARLQAEKQKKFFEGNEDEPQKE